MKKAREVVTYKDYFEEFFEKQSQKVRDKIIKVLDIIEQIERVPVTYLKYIEGTNGLFEIRVQLGSDIFRIFCFFDGNKMVVLLCGFQKKTQRRDQKSRKNYVGILRRKKKGDKKMKTKTLDQIKTKYYGEIGTPERDRIERDLDALRIGLKIRTAREQKEMTQAQLADRIDKKRTFISKVENDGGNITLKTLFDIVERGLGGKLHIDVQL